MGGIMSITGEKKGLPTKIGVGVSDIITGLYSTISILSAIKNCMFQSRFFSRESQ